MKLLLIATILAISATGQTGIKETRLRDGVVRYDRPPTRQPAFWEELLSRFSLEPTNTLPFRRSVAFLTGVSRYSNISEQLDYVETDLRELRTFLLNEGGFDTVFEARNELVSRGLIEDYMLNKFSKPSSDFLTKDDRLLFYYSGHGDDQQGQIGYLQFSRAKRGDFSGDQVMPVSLFQDWAKVNVAKHLLIILDACAAGLAVQSKGDPTHTSILSSLSGQGSGYLLTAGTAEQRAWQIKLSKDRGYSVFTHALLDALKTGTYSDGFATITEAFGRAQKSVAEFAASENRRVNPQLSSLARQEGGGTFVFLNKTLQPGRLLPEYRDVLKSSAKSSNETSSGAMGVIEVVLYEAGSVLVEGINIGNLRSGESRMLQGEPLGKRHITVQFDSGKIMEQDVVVESGRIIRAVFAAKSPIDNTGVSPVGGIYMISAVVGAVLIDDVPVGTVERDEPFVISNVLAGEHEIRIEGPARIARQKVNVRSGQTEYIKTDTFLLFPPTSVTATVH